MTSANELSMNMCEYLADLFVCMCAYIIRANMRVNTLTTLCVL